MAISLFVQCWRSVVVGQSGRMVIFFLLFNLVMPNAPSLSFSVLMSNVWCQVSFLYYYFFCFSLLLGKYLYCIVMSIFVYYLLTYFVFLESSENSKKRKSVTSAICYSISHFGTDWVILALFLSIHVLNFAP